MTIGAAPAAWKPSIRGRARGAVRGVLDVAPPVRRDVAGVADGQAVHVGGVAEHVEDLERRGLLALDAERVDAVDERDGVVLGQVAAQVEAVVEVALDLQQLRAVHERLGELAERDLALGHEHGAGQAGPRGVGRRRRAGVAGEAQMTAWLPSSTALLMAIVMPRSLKDPVGLAPSTLRYTSQPVSSDRCGAGTSGVPPSRSVTTGVVVA